MMLLLGAHILADVGDIPIKLIVGIIIAILWGIGALANMGKKQQAPQQQPPLPPPGQFDPNRGAMERAMREQMDAARRMQAAEALARGQMGAPPGFQFPQQQQHQPQRGPSVPPMRTRPPQQQRPPQQRPGGVRRPPPPLPPALPPAMQQHQPGRPGGGPVVPPRRTKKAERRPQQQRPAAEPVLEELTGYSEGPSRPGVRESEIGAGTAPASPARRAAAASPVVRLTPQSLRQQFILTEILQPPLALRAPREV
jgi:hypothetical protein